MSYSINQLRLKVMDCAEDIIPSQELGEYAYDAWHYLNENKADDAGFMGFLVELSSEWGFLVAAKQDAKFDREFLKNLLARIENYMNIGPEDTQF